MDQHLLPEAGFDTAAIVGIPLTKLPETVKINSDQTFLDIGCGTGVVSIVLAKSALSGVGTDINKLAVENSQFNAKRYNIENVDFIQSDLFDNVNGKFDVIVCNPPYSNFSSQDDIDKMYWDKDNEMKQRFFKEVNSYLNDKGMIYFGWANFADLDLDLPFKLAEDNGFEVIEVKSKKSPNKTCTFYVLEISRREHAKV